MRNKFILSGGQSAKLETAIDRNGGATTDVEWLCAGQNFGAVMSLARGEAELVLKARPVAPVAVINPIVRVNRSVRPIYPDFLNQDHINQPEFIALEKSGPAEFDASRLRQWLHPKQKRGKVHGNIIHAALINKKNLIDSCLGFADLLGIQAKGLEFYRRYFKGKTVFGWRLVVPHLGGSLRVPVLVESDGEVVLCWYWLGSGGGFDVVCPALRFPKQPLSP